MHTSTRASEVEQIWILCEIRWRLSDKKIEPSLPDFIGDPKTLQTICFYGHKPHSKAPTSRLQHLSMTSQSLLCPWDSEHWFGWFPLVLEDFQYRQVLPRSVPLWLFFIEPLCTAEAPGTWLFCIQQVLSYSSIQETWAWHEDRVYATLFVRIKVSKHSSIHFWSLKSWLQAVMVSQDRPARCVPSADWATLWNEISRALTTTQQCRRGRCNSNTHRQTLWQSTRCSRSDAWRLAQVVALPLQVQHGHTVYLPNTPIVSPKFVIRLSR